MAPVKYKQPEDENTSTPTPVGDETTEKISITVTKFGFLGTPVEVPVGTKIGEIRSQFHFNQEWEVVVNTRRVSGDYELKAGDKGYAVPDAVEGGKMKYNAR